MESSCQFNFQFFYEQINRFKEELYYESDLCDRNSFRKANKFILFRNTSAFRFIKVILRIHGFENIFPFNKVEYKDDESN